MTLRAPPPLTKSAALWQFPCRRTQNRAHMHRTSPAAYRRCTPFALAAQGVMRVSGAAVRLTGSGLGCPKWPNCDTGHLSPHGTTGYHGYVEFVNRVFTGLVSILVVLAVLGSLVRVPRRRDLTWLSV